jgi:hypothetical protein
VQEPLAKQTMRLIAWRKPWGEHETVQVNPQLEYYWCREHFQFFLHYVAVDNPQKGGAVAFERWPYLLDVADSWQRGENCIEGKARQLGYSWLIAAFVLWVITFRDGAKVLVISMGQREAKDLVSKVRFIHDNLPSFLRLAYKRANEEDIELEGSRGAVKVLPSTPNAGSGYTASVVVTDEWAKHPFAGANFAAFRPAVADGGQHIAISTGNGPTGMFAEYFKDETNGYVRRFNGWDARPDRDAAWYAREKAAYGSDARGLDRFLQENPSSPEEMFRVFEGQVYTDYQEDLHGHFITPPFTWRESKIRVAAVDFGQGDPAAIVCIGQRDDGFAFQHNEWTQEGTTSIYDIANELMVWHRMAPFHAILCDKSEGTAIATLRTMGLPAVGSEDIADRGIGIGVVKSFLVSMMYGHMATHVRTKREFQSYRFRMRQATGETNAYATSTPVDHHGDHLDCIRWCLMALSQGGLNMPSTLQPTFSRQPDNPFSMAAKGPDIARTDRAAEKFLPPAGSKILNPPASGPDWRSQTAQPSFAPRPRSPVPSPASPAKPKGRGW